MRLRADANNQKSKTKGKIIMKKMRRTMAAVMAAAMMATCTAGMTMFSASAEEPTPAYTVNITCKDKGAHTFEAYQIFSGTLSTDGKTLSNIEWGSGIDSTKTADLITDLKTNLSSVFGDDITTSSSAADIAAKMAGKTADGTEARQFAEIVAKYLSNTKVSATSTVADGAAAATCSITTITQPGYYLFKDNDDKGENGFPLDSPTNTVYTNYLLKVIQPTTTLNVKGEVPTVTKKIVEDDGDVTCNTASIGDTINYKITSTVPSGIREYNEYFFVFTDKMSAGLSYNNDVSVKVAGSAYDTNKIKTEYTSSTNVLKVCVQDLDNVMASATGDVNVEVTYSAILNANANMVSTAPNAGNPNKVDLTYSNDPNFEYSYDTNGFPKPDQPTGITPESKVNSFTTGVKLTKTDADGGAAMKGVKFRLSGTSMDVVISENEYFEKDSSGTYYMLKNGTFTTDKPVAAGGEKADDAYASTSEKYEKVNVANEDSAPVAINLNAETDASGIIEFKGLQDGIYYLTETETLDGYNLLKEPVKIQIIRGEMSVDSCEWSGKKNDSDNLILDGTNYLPVGVTNSKGTQLPETGGIGTTIFYVGGSALLVGAAAVFVTKKRKKAE